MKYVIHILVLLFSCLIFSYQSAFSQITLPSDYVVKNWGMKEGLPQSSVNDILQSQDGYLWFATFGGLVRFDGSSFTTFDRFNTPGMRSDRILSIYEDRQGALWLGTEDGFLRFQNDSCKTFLFSQGKQIYAPLCVAEDSRHVLWISANGHPYRFSNGTFVEEQVIKNSLLAVRAEQDKRGVWIAHERELLRTLGDSVILIKDLKSVSKSNVRKFIEYPAHSGAVYLGTSGDGVIRYENGKLAFFNKEQGLPSQYIWKLYSDRKNILWANCYNGLSYWNGSSFVPFTAITASNDIQFTALCEDTEGDFWLGTPSRGVYKVRPSIISTIGPAQGLWNDKMLSLTKLKNGKILFATNCGGVYEWKNDSARYLPLNSSFPNLCIWSIFEDSQKNIWYGSEVLYKTAGLTGKGILYDSSNGFDGANVYALFEDSHKNIWIGCFNGTYVYNGKSFLRYTTNDGLSYNDTRVFFEDKSGEIWIGTSSGLNIFKNGIITQINLLGSDTVQLRKPYIRAIYEDDDGTMWFGSYGDGLIRMKDGKVRYITTHDGMFSNIVSHIIEDENGNFWMGSNNGISRVSKKELNELCDGKRKTLRTYSYGLEEGMASAETNGGFQPSVLQEKDGTIFFPTVSGVAVVSTQKAKTNLVSPPVRIEKIESEDLKLPLTDVVTLSYDSSNIEIQYTALSFPEPNKVRYKYKMKGYNNSWYSAGTKKTAFYSKLPPGEYLFTVIACNNDGIWNETGASLKIVVLPPFWLKPWFITLCLLAFITTGPLIFYFRVKKLNAEKDKQEQFSQQLINSQEQERRRIATELHDGLGQQILVIKNRAELALQQVSEPQKIIEQLREIMRSAVSSIKDIRTISHNLRPVHLEQFGLTEALLNFCEQLQHTSSIEWSYYVDTIDGLISKEKEINFYRIIQEATNNILKHSAAKQASIIVRCDEKTISVMLSDDGKGFALQERKTSGGLGLLGINERVKSLGAVMDLQSSIDSGTVLRITIPIHAHA